MKVKTGALDERPRFGSVAFLRSDVRVCIFAGGQPQSTASTPARPERHDFPYSAE
jgi:hypothetical protein